MHSAGYYISHLDVCKLCQCRMAALTQVRLTLRQKVMHCAGGTGTYSFKGQFIQRSIHKSSQRFASLCVVKKPAAGPTTCSHY